MENSCPLCHRHELIKFHQDQIRLYLRCQHCHLVCVPPDFHLPPEDEKKVYLKHNNTSEDVGYRRFLSRLSLPMTQRLPKDARGLDFGCGPGPTLSVLFEEKGYRMSVYDPFFANNRKVLSDTYDFISCSEVIEHLQQPWDLLSIVQTQLNPEGVLGIMTKLVSRKSAFPSWHYIRDPTHVCFYSQETFEFIAHRLQMNIEFIGNDVILLVG